MQNALDKQRRIIWVRDRKGKYSNIYSSVIENPKCEIITINYSSLKVFEVPVISFENNEEITILAFSIKDFYIACKIRKEYTENKIKIFYLVPLFTGSSIFPDECFNGILNIYIKRHFARVYKLIDSKNSLYFFSSSFYHALEDNYGIKFSTPEKELVPITRKKEEFDTQTVQNTYLSKPFTIISAGRFDFPHKGFLLGLIKSFAKLRMSNLDIKLLIVGDGPDKNQVISTIKQQPETVQNSIELRTPLEKKDLVHLMKQCNLNISVAGCAHLGASAGVPTLPARHYYTECEVYGFLPEAKDMLTERKPGYPVEDYIEKVMNMSFDEYLNLAKNTYSCFNYTANTEFPFDCDCDTSYIPTKSDFCKMWVVYTLQRIKHHISSLHREVH